MLNDYKHDQILYFFQATGACMENDIPGLDLHIYVCMRTQNAQVSMCVCTGLPELPLLVYHVTINSTTSFADSF